MKNTDEKEIYVNHNSVNLSSVRHDNIFINNRKRYWMFKRIFDIIFSVLVILLFSPVFIAITLLIFIDDPKGSPIYKQVRVGRHGKVFNLYKFRTMVVNADELLEELKTQNEADGPNFKIKNDPRITKIGGFLRKTSLDELPQFFNVLKGNMTVVGPRPALPKEVEQYTEEQKVRLIVTPGLTCMWQVTDNRNDIPFEDWMRLDLDYIDKRTFWQDIKLIFKTVAVMFKCGGR